MELKTYSRARAAVAAAKDFCTKNNVVPDGEIIAIAHGEGKFAALIPEGGRGWHISTDNWLVPVQIETKKEITFEQGPADVPYPAPAAEAAPEAPKAKAIGYIAERSSLEKPTKKVWHIADKMKGQPRKDVIAECRRQGIAFGTARTQYQEWKKANGL